MDVHDKETRSYNMSRIRSANTKPEELVRKYLFAKGFRYRKNLSSLPGKPDIVLPKYKTCIFINGCFWHKHEGCRYFVWPKNNAEFWKEKISSNVARDKMVYNALKELGWDVVVIWECGLKRDKKEQTLEALYQSLKDKYPEMATQFSGKLNRIQLTSNNICFGPCPKPEDEVEQHLTITADGHVWLSRYCYGENGLKLTLKRREAFSIPTRDTDYIMGVFTSYFEKGFDNPFVTDVGSWNLTLTNSDGVKYKVSGPLCQDLHSADGGLSTIIRTRLGRSYLFVFDGLNEEQN